MASAAANTGSTHHAPNHRRRPTIDRDAERAAGEALWALVDRVQAGDVSAFGELYDATAPGLYRFAYFRMGRDRTLAEDTVAETYARALARIGTLQRGSGSPAAWLVTITRNLICDHFKSHRVRREQLVDDVLAPAGTEQYMAADIAGDATAYLSATELWRVAQRELTDDQLECLVLRFLQGFSVAETGAAMGRHDSAIKALQFRATASLRRALSGTGLDPRVLAGV